jgi:UDP-N-acetylmuramoyl-tripeptide--D-alanyl-D-alanine ligase
VENVHAEFFSSEEEIADAKAEIFTGLAHDGAVILNRDNRQFARLEDAAKAAGVERILTFGVHERADARLITHVAHAECVCVAAKLNGEDVRYKVGAPGKHWAMNSLAVLLAAKTLGADPGLAAIAMAKIRPPEGRGQRHFVHLDDLSFELIDESYNASPIAVRAALAVLGESQVGARGRRIAVLGDMLELGEQTMALHSDLADAVVASDADTVFTCGPAMKSLHNNLPKSLQTHHAVDSEGLIEPLLETIAAGDVVMVKGSLGSRMRPIVDALLALGRPRRFVATGR